MNSSLRQPLAEFFLSSAEAIARRLKRNQYPLVVSVRRACPVHLHHSWGIREEGSSINILASDRLWPQRGSPQLTTREIRNAIQIGKDIADSAIETLPFWQNFPGNSGMLAPNKHDGTPDFGTDPGGWVARCIVLPALQAHLVALSGLAHADSVNALAFADDVIRVAHDDRLRYRETALIGGIDLDSVDGDEFRDRNVTVRRISEDEQVEWLKKSSYTRVLEGEDPPTAVLEVRSDAPRDLNEPEWHDVTSILVAALQINGHRITGSIATENVEPNWLFRVVSRNQLTLPLTTRGRLEQLSKDDIMSFFNTARILKDFNIVEPRSVRDLALHRFVSGCARELPADALIDFAIALESLLLPYDANARRGDLSYRFRIHGAHYLAADVPDRNEVFKQLRNIYDTRSRLVHGAKYPSEAETIATRDAAYDLARRGLRKAVYEGFPTAEVFQQMALGSTCMITSRFATTRSEPPARHLQLFCCCRCCQPLVLFPISAFFPAP